MNRRTGSAVLGFSGSLYPTSVEYGGDARRIRPPRWASHDAAAAVVLNGQLAAAIEEERLNRIKHTNRLPIQAIRECLQIAELDVESLDAVAYYCSEQRMNERVAAHVLDDPQLPRSLSGRSYIVNALAEAGVLIDVNRLRFVDHHLCHAAGAFLLSPFREALVVTLDGQGDGLSGTVSLGRDGELTRLRSIDAAHSLGILYALAIRYLGYGLFDEYKVMGLAPYGDPSRFRSLFETICTTGPSGEFRVNLAKLADVGRILPHPRGESDPIERIHQDLAAALQEAIERVTLHFLSHLRRETGLRHLVLAGGVAHNSTMNGRIAREGLFDAIFAHPASNDAGCAVGAAVSVAQTIERRTTFGPLRHAYLGRDVGTDDDVMRALERWGSCIDVTPSRRVVSTAATLLARGAVIGWIQGRSEFGPRALGNRSILADPRPATNKRRLNDLIKMREDYRPFAPAVPQEHADELFEVPPGSVLDFMSFTVPVRDKWRDRLAAVTHVDGSARIQLVHRDANPRFWELLNAFGELTGVPVLLNTSFNHSVEPIVDSIDDAIACFLTTGLTHVVAGSCIVTKRAVGHEMLPALVPTQAQGTRIVTSVRTDSRGARITEYLCDREAAMMSALPMSLAVSAILSSADGVSPLAEICNRLGIPDAAAVRSELWDLWCERAVRFLPRTCRGYTAEGGAADGQATSVSLVS